MLLLLFLGLAFHPAVSQTVMQPAAGGTDVGTSLNANVFQQVRYFDQFQWSQSPAGSISAGVNTITINAIRGIDRVISVPPGILSTYHVTHRIRIAGTGTPEVVTLTATTCNGGTSGTCTITFTAAYSHAAGYTVGTATAGLEEANVDCFGKFNGTNPTTDCVIKGSPYTLNGHFVLYGQYNMNNISGSGGSITLDCSGATLEDHVSKAAMILYGGGSWLGPEHGNIHNCHFSPHPGVGRAATGKQMYILDEGQNLAMRNNTFNGYINNKDLMDTGVEVSGDQGFIFDFNDVSGGGTIQCDSTFCGPFIYGDSAKNAAIGHITDNNFTGGGGMSTFAAAVEWDSGNGLTLSHNVFQGWAKYPWRYLGGLVPMTNQGGNYYEANPAAVNPDFGVAGYSVSTGPQVGLSGSVQQYSPGIERGAGLSVHRFSATGSKIYSYYIVGNNGTGRSTRPLYIGDAATDGVKNFTVLFLKFDASTYDVLRAGPQHFDGNDAAPYGAGNWAVATGITCKVNPCSYTETFAAPTSYTVKGEFQGGSYTPVIPYWPVPLFLQATSGVASEYVGPATAGFVSDGQSNAYWAYYDAIFTVEGASNSASNLTGMHILHLAPLQAGGGTNDNPGAMILNPDVQSIGMQNRKGRINVPSESFAGGANWSNNLIYQSYDSEANKTLATAGHQPSLAAADHGIGYDNDPSRQATMCGGTSCTWYVNHVPDSGKSYKMRLTSSALDLPVGSVLSINGTSVVQAPPACSFGTVFSVASAGADALSGMANRATVWGFYNAAPCATSKVAFNAQVADNTAHTYDLGIYKCTDPCSGARGTLVFHTGSMTGTSMLAATGLRGPFNWTAPGVLGVGRYYVALTSNCTAACAKISGLNGTGGLYLSGAVIPVPSGGTLSTTVTLPTDAATASGSPPWLLIY